ncbi:monovalent cation/H+ antiporter complex subunit F [Blastochloris tepida]|jgi:multicomponent Na+:H+ antiporter subunit F|uniref:Sodium:proton antiporter n=1 Tax=Blastochloris tepida TaxID=2233851 RepID=A0A348G2Z1_9HYPH|nr:monovalent cation/H+ antiporter complex subunit F [Blastochloris tepida]BBF93924.1 sodium:proton antiporter [Blastochloris tepida]
MYSFMLGAAGFVLVVVALGLARVLRGPGRADRMMAMQLLGTGGIAVLLLFSIANSLYAVVDVALVLAVLSVFASVALVETAPPDSGDAA